MLVIGGPVQSKTYVITGDFINLIPSVRKLLGDHKIFREAKGACLLGFINAEGHIHGMTLGDQRGTKKLSSHYRHGGKKLWRPCTNASQRISSGINYIIEEKGSYHHVI